MNAAVLLPVNFLGASVKVPDESSGQLRICNAELQYPMPPKRLLSAAFAKDTCSVLYPFAVKANVSLKRALNLCTIVVKLCADRPPRFYLHSRGLFQLL